LEEYTRNQEQEGRPKTVTDAEWKKSIRDIKKRNDDKERRAQKRREIGVASRTGGLSRVWEESSKDAAREYGI